MCARSLIHKLNIKKLYCFSIIPIFRDRYDEWDKLDVFLRFCFHPYFFSQQNSCKSAVELSKFSLSSLLIDGLSGMVRISDRCESVGEPGTVARFRRIAKWRSRVPNFGCLRTTIGFTSSLVLADEGLTLVGSVVGATDSFAFSMWWVKYSSVAFRFLICIFLLSLCVFFNLNSSFNVFCFISHKLMLCHLWGEGRGRTQIEWVFLLLLDNVLSS